MFTSCVFFFLVYGCYFSFSCVYPEGTQWEVSSCQHLLEYVLAVLHGDIYTLVFHCGFVCISLRLIILRTIQVFIALLYGKLSS